MVFGTGVLGPELDCSGAVGAGLSCAGVPCAVFACAVLAWAELACAVLAAGGEVGFEPDGNPFVPGGRHAESPSIKTGTNASPMRCLRVRHAIAAPYLPDQKIAARCITTLPIILPNGRGG